MPELRGQGRPAFHAQTQVTSALEVMQLGPMVEQCGAERRQLVGCSTPPLVALKCLPNQLALLVRRPFWGTARLVEMDNGC